MAGIKHIILVLLIALYFGVAFLSIIAFFKPYFTKDKEEKKARPVIYLNLAQAYKYNKDYEKSKNSLSIYFIIEI